MPRGKPKQFPVIYMQLPSIIKDHTEAIEIVSDSKFIDHYQYQGKNVPRVSNILDNCIGKRGLVNWGARIGYTKMERIRSESLKVGSVVHEMIAYNLETGKEMTINYDQMKINANEARMIRTAYANYKCWKENLYNGGNHIDKIIGSEVTVTCPWYGGTIDCLMVINGATYIIDFKTSKQINMEYLLQVCSYAWMVNSGYCSICDHVDGVGILRFDKSYKGSFEEHFLNFHIPYQYEYIFQYTNTFWALVNSFYNLAYSDHITDETVGDPDHYIESITKEAEKYPDNEDKTDGK